MFSVNKLVYPVINIDNFSTPARCQTFMPVLYFKRFSNTKILCISFWIPGCPSLTERLLIQLDSSLDLSRHVVLVQRSQEISSLMKYSAFLENETEKKKELHMERRRFYIFILFILTFQCF